MCKDLCNKNYVKFYNRRICFCLVKKELCEIQVGDYSEQSKSIPFTLYTHSICQCLTNQMRITVLLFQMSLKDSTPSGSQRMCSTGSSMDFLTLPFPTVSSRTFPEDRECLLLEVTILPFPRWSVLSCPSITLHGNWCLHFCYRPSLYMRAETGSQCLVQST